MSEWFPPLGAIQFIIVVVTITVIIMVAAVLAERGQRENEEMRLPQDE